MSDAPTLIPLVGHTTPETAYVVDDYPYGFRLRCKIRYWLECKPRQGYRLCSQTTNPKVAREVWNKPKCSTYAPLGVMGLDASGHVQWVGVRPYDLERLREFDATYGQSFDEGQRKTMDAMIAAVEHYEARRKAALPPTRVGMWYASGPAGGTYTPGDPEWNLHRVIADTCDTPGCVLVENAGGSQFPVAVSLIDEIAAQPPAPTAPVALAGPTLADEPILTPPAALWADGQEFCSVCGAAYGDEPEPHAPDCPNKPVMEVKK